ncbi:MAG: VOC family protein, partial [Plesiomonas shigelloides]
MIPRESILRVARPTDNLDKIKYMYMTGLGFS